MRTLWPLQRVWMPLLAGLCQLSPVSTARCAGSGASLVYIGTYTGAKSQGIYLARFDAAAGTLTPPELAVATRNPTFLAVHPNGRVLYAVNEVSDFGQAREGAVSAFAVDQKTGQLRLINQASAGGAGPCHLALDRTGQWVLVANYGSGTVAALRVQTEGSLSSPAISIQHHGSSVNPRRQSGPHAHYIAPDPANRFVLACDLGLDKILIYRLNPATEAGPILTPSQPASVSLPPGAGPRHLAFHPTGRFAYVLNEMGSTVTVLAYAPKQGALTALQTLSTLPDDFKGENSCAEVQVHPSGRVVYASNRGHNSIAVFATDPKTGKLSPPEHVPTQGRTTRHFTLDPSARWLLAENQDSDSIVVFAVEAKTGRLHPTGHQIQVAAPVCVAFVP